MTNKAYTGKVDFGFVYFYQNYLIREYEMFHSAHNRAQGRELIITNIPENHFHWR